MNLLWVIDHSGNAYLVCSVVYYDDGVHVTTFTGEKYTLYSSERSSMAKAAQAAIVQHIAENRTTVLDLRRIRLEA